MGDKENAPPLGARGAAAPRLTRAAAKRAAAAAAAAEGPGDAKRRRVALGELPALANNAGLRAPSCPVKPSKPASRPGRHARNVAPEARGPSSAHEAERCASSPPRTADADAESNSVSNPAPRATAYADSCASSSPPRAAAAGAPADPQLCGSYASDIYTYLRSLEVLSSVLLQPLASPRIRHLRRSDAGLLRIWGCGCRWSRSGGPDPITSRRCRRTLRRTCAASSSTGWSRSPRSISSSPTPCTSPSPMWIASSPSMRSAATSCSSLASPPCSLLRKCHLPSALCHLLLILGHCTIGD
jgi:hypothetical protein